MDHLGNSDIIVMAAAVSDYTPEKPAKEKIKKGDEATFTEAGKNKRYTCKSRRTKNRRTKRW